MFETQSKDEWLPEWARWLRPFLISLLITPIALLVGLSDFGPEGPQVWIGFAIFPFSGILFVLSYVFRNEAFFFLMLGVALIQFPVYGLAFSLMSNRRMLWRTIVGVHLMAIVVFVIGLLTAIILARTSQPG
jgi:hypothetical protein